MINPSFWSSFTAHSSPFISLQIFIQLPRCGCQFPLQTPLSLRLPGVSRGRWVAGVFLPSAQALGALHPSQAGSLWCQVTQQVSNFTDRFTSEGFTQIAIRIFGNEFKNPNLRVQMSVSPARSKLDLSVKEQDPFCSRLRQSHQTPFQVIRFSVLTCFYSLRFKASFLCRWWVSRDESDVAAIFMDSCSLVPYFVALNRNLVPVFFHFTYLLTQFCCLKPLKGSQILSKYRPCCRRPQMFQNA